jgi:hypothetical protein
MAQQIQLRRDTAANWGSVNPTLALGELGIETDTARFKIGNGTSAWNSLNYQTTFPYTTRSDVNGVYIYSGRANPGTAESSTGWTIKRIQQDSQGNVVSNLTATGAWTNRYSLIYS